MDKQIEFNSLKEFSKSYRKVRDIKLEKKLKTTNIVYECVDKSVKKENKFLFNFELEPCKIYNQNTSKLCWLFGVLNLIKNDVAHNLEQNPLEFELSANYLSFYDKLEKANHLYQTIIDLEIEEYDDFQLCFYQSHPLLTGYLKDPVKENGKPQYARELIKKYGLVPAVIYPQTENSKHPDVFMKYYSQKVKQDCFALLNAKRNNEKNLYDMKEKFLCQCYRMLAQVYGEPPTSFSYSYTNTKGQRKFLRNITPQEFYQKYCSINLDDFVLIANIPQKKKPYYKKYQKMYSGNIEGKSAFEYINVPQKVLTNLCLKQLLSNMPVVISCDSQKYRDVESKILDTRLFTFDKSFGLKEISKQQGLESYDICGRHLMTVRGVHLEKGEPIRWKVEDSAGEESRNNGYYVMNHNFLKKCVFYAMIDKKFLSKKILAVLNEEPIMFGFEDTN